MDVTTRAKLRTLWWTRARSNSQEGGDIDAPPFTLCYAECLRSSEHRPQNPPNCHLMLYDNDEPPERSFTACEF